jgi:hypothetical protein
LKSQALNDFGKYLSSYKPFENCSTSLHAKMLYMNNPQFSCSQSIVKMMFLFVPLILFFTSCKKNSVRDEINTSTNKEISFKTEQWNAYPYIGGPGEDSMYSSWSPQLSVISSQNIKEISIKTKSGSLYTAKLFVQVSQNDSGYLYQMGDPLGKPGTLLLWWIQKQPGQKPDADSAFISLH